jgi:hypothetical protein
MAFALLDFRQLNEADIREEVIAPLLRRLGYRSGTVNNVIREQPLSLRYPRAFLGRKNPNKDPLLRGKADYICEVEGPIRWVIEAKPPSAEITLDDIEQAFTYANHPEVRAVLYCVCNGQELKAFQTNQGPDAEPLLSIQYPEFDDRFDEIGNLLLPKSIRREFWTLVVDTGKPLGPGLRSIVRVTGGQIEYLDNSWNLPYLKNFILAITGGSIERNENNQMVAIIKTLSPYASFQKLNERLGMHEIEAISTDEVVSIDPNNPTRFVSRRTVVFPQGETVLNLATWREDVFQMNIPCETLTTAEGVLDGQVFSGQFFLSISLSVPGTTIAPLETVGRFEIHVA